MSERQILITIDTPHWDDDDHAWLIEQVYNAIVQEIPKGHFTVQEFAK